MIHLPHPQGGADWINARLGIATASQFHRIITPKTAKPAAAAEKYLHQLCAEWAIGQPIAEYEDVQDFMQRGTDMEKEAVAWYELQRETDTTVAGFCLTDDRRAGCSPDRLVGEDGGLEIKCPSAAVHVGYLLGQDPDAYRAQVQGALWITGRAWWDRLSYHPTMPSVLIRQERDEEFIARLAALVSEFCERLEAAKARMRGLGCAPAIEAT